MGNVKDGGYQPREEEKEKENVDCGQRCFFWPNIEGCKVWVSKAPVNPCPVIQQDTRDEYKVDRKKDGVERHAANTVEEG